MSEPVSFSDLIAAENWKEILDKVEGEKSPQACRAAYRANIELGYVDQAEQWLNRILKNTPQDVSMLRNKGALHLKRGEIDKAIHFFSKAVTLRPDVASFHGSLAGALFRKGDYRGAEKEYEQALIGNKKVFSWWNGLARSLAELGETRRAVEAGEQALSLQDNLSLRAICNELRRQLESGQSSVSEQYYDEVFFQSPEYSKPGGQSLYAPVWRQIIEILHQQGSKSILDLGCGPGQFGEFMSENSLDVLYCGVDFSSEAINQARRRCPTGQFFQVHLPMEKFTDLPGFDTVICMEVLEHIDKDRETLANLPAGVFIVATVPNFDSFGHVRIFKYEKEILDRYGDLIEITHIKKVHLSKKSFLWIICGVTQIVNIQC